MKRKRLAIALDPVLVDWIEALEEVSYDRG